MGIRISALAAALLAVIAAPALAQPAPKTAWFGVPTPPGITDGEALTYDAKANAFGMPAYIQRRIADPTGALKGDKMMRDVRTLVEFSRDRRKAGDKLWGRIAGLPGQRVAAEWTVARLKAAGLKDAHVQEYAVERPVWLPTAWEVRLSGLPQFGEGTRDVVLQSAFPTPQGATMAAPITAPLVFVGRGSAAELANIDVRGKIAVVNVVPNISLFGSRERGVAQELVKRGAVGVLNAVESPGNLQFYDGRYACGTGPCFLLGGDDGAFLESVIGKAAAAGQLANLKATLSLKSETRSGLTALNGVATIPGKSPETIIINSHVDAWFDGANDNADGMAVFLGLAEHFAKRHEQPAKTLVFMVSGGHHTGNGPAAFVKANPQIIANTVMIMNLEHLAQINIPQMSRLDPAVAGYGSGIWQATTAETSKKVSATDSTPAIFDLLARAARDFGVVTGYQSNEAPTGDLGGYRPTGKPTLQLISSEVYYHSSGDSPNTISAPGMERIADFYVFLIDEIAKMPKDRIARAGPPAAGRTAAANDD